MTEDPRDTRIIRLRGKGARFTLVSACDYVRVLLAGPWYTKPSRYTAYARRGPHGNQQHLHSFIAGFTFTDHINGCGLDNRRGNLRPATAQQNAQNSRGKKKGRISRYKGVSPNRNNKRNPWSVFIRVNGDSRYVGCFPTESEAAWAYDEAAVEAFGQYANTNFEPRRSWRVA